MNPTFLGMLLTGCAELPVPDRPVHAPLVPVETIATLDLDAVLPSDVLLRDDGSVLVLDGYGGRVLQVDVATQKIQPFSTSSIGRGARLASASDGGVWVTRPGHDDEVGSLLHLNAQGQPIGVTVPVAADQTPLHPVDVLDIDGALVVADRTAGLVWLGPDAVARQVVTTGMEAQPLRRVVDLSLLADGIAAVDTFAHRTVLLSPEGAPTSAFGRSGLSVGTFARPTSVAQAAGGLLVSDAVLGAVQAFEADGDLIGALGIGAAALKLGHPVAVRTNPRVPRTAVVLEATPARLQVLRLPEALPAAGPPPLLRTNLVEAEVDPAGESGASCLQCHDGLVLDSRELWDPARKHHPVNIKPEGTIPAFFPLDDQGQLTCRSCHSPHGTVEEAAADTAPLVRHASPESAFMRLEESADTLCVACHTGAVHDRADGLPAEGGHPAGAALLQALAERGEDNPTGASCLSCHATHGAAAEPLLRDTDDASACVGCHREQKQASTNHPLGRVPGKDLLRAANHVRISADGGVGCLSCHDLTTRSPDLLRTQESGKAVCFACHAERGDLSKGAHHTLGGRGTPACVACHDVHGGDRDAHFVATKPTTDADPTGCLSCHGPGGSAAQAGVSPGRLGHPVTGSALTHAGADPSEKLDCLACHDPHLADAPSAADCETCHATQAAAKQAGGHGETTCLDCHAAHGADPRWSGDENPASHPCLTCHATARGDAPAIANYEHPTPMFLPDGSRWTPLAGLVLYGADGEPVAAGANGDLTCQSCHVVHGPDGTADKLRRAGGWQEACAACHGENGLVYYRYFHDPERRAALTGGTP